MDLVCYVHPAWSPLIRPAPATRQWMDETSESFAYRCLPLNIANAHGWEVLCPCGVRATWDGGIGVEAITVELTPGAASASAPVSLFGNGVLTFHVEGILRTPPGWDLWVGGSPNRQKDGIAPLTGIVEADWSPFTFTMNWRFTRPHATVEFAAMEPIAMLVPVRRGALEAFRPRFEPIESDPLLLERFTSWSEARNAFHEKMRAAPPVLPADKWQKHYYRGVDASGTSLTDDHRTKVRLQAFDRGAVPGLAATPADDARSTAPAPNDRPLALRRETWWHDTLRRQHALASTGPTLARRGHIDSDEFLERYYAPARPLILTDAMSDWAAPDRWTPAYLAGGHDPKDLRDDIGSLDACLAAERTCDAIRVVAAGAATPRTQARRNLLLAQIRGRTLVVLDSPQRDRAAVRLEAILRPGDILFLPVGWHHETSALDDGITATFSEFLWPNDGASDYPEA